MKCKVRRMAVMVCGASLLGTLSAQAAASKPVAMLGEDIAIMESDVRTIVRSPIEFVYERPDQPALVKFREEAKLDEVVGTGSDFDQLVRLMDWVGSLHNDRTDKRHRKGGYYQWGLEHLLSQEEDGSFVIYGHCMSYAAVMIDACSALGFKARHYSVAGFREMSHEVVEAWVPSLGKWVYFDPSLTQYYKDLETGQPLSLLEMQRIVVNTFIPEGKTTAWLIQRKSKETREVVRKIGGQTPIAVRQGPWHYGKPAEAGYEWGWRHGYLVAGYLQMTPRNDFNSNPDANPRKFEYMPGYADYPFWVDEKTHPRNNAKNLYSKESDFYWTLDQAAFVLEPMKGKDGALRVKLEQSMPFFSYYLVTIDGESQRVEADVFEWTLKDGANVLEVIPVDEFGQTGAGSRVKVAYDA